MHYAMHNAMDLFVFAFLGGAGGKGGGYTLANVNNKPAKQNTQV